MKIKITEKNKKPRKTTTRTSQKKPFASTQGKSDVAIFFEALEKNTSFDSREPNKILFDSGLIILKKSNSAAVKSVLGALPKGKAVTMKLDNQYFADDFFKKLVMVNREGQWLIVECSCDPAPVIIQTLKQISQDNEFSISHFEGKELFSMKMNPKSRVVFLIEDSVLEKEITYPYFMNLFGPVLRME